MEAELDALLKDESLQDLHGEMIKSCLANLCNGGESIEIKELPVVGRGPSALVHRWTVAGTCTDVALKAVPLSMQENLRDTMLATMRYMYANEHPCIVRFYGVEYFKKQHAVVIATEFMNQGSLDNQIKLRGKMSEGALKYVAKQLVSALTYLHKKREPHVIHRAVKPSNILVNDQGEVKLTDFGLGSVLTATFAPRLTWLGSQTYMSPERICGMPHLGNCDVWSLGVTLVEVATGRGPYDTEPGQTPSFGDQLDRIVDGPPPGLDAAVYSADCCDFIAKCCVKSRDLRPFAEQLEDHPFLADARREDLLAYLALPVKQTSTDVSTPLVHSSSSYSIPHQVIPTFSTSSFSSTAHSFFAPNLHSTPSTEEPPTPKPILHQLSSASLPDTATAMEQQHHVRQVSTPEPLHPTYSNSSSLGRKNGREVEFLLNGMEDDDIADVFHAGESGESDVSDDTVCGHKHVRAEEGGAGMEQQQKAARFASAEMCA